MCKSPGKHISLRSCDPQVPESLNDRAQDNVRALCAIADVVGGHWRETLRQAFVGLAQAREEAQQVSNGVMLLHDIAEVLEGYTDPKIGSGELQQKLVFLEDSAWNIGTVISRSRQSGSHNFLKSSRFTLIVTQPVGFIM